MKNEFDANQMNRFLLEEYRRKAKIYKNQLLECREDKIKALDKIRAEIGKSKTEHEMQLAENDIKGKLLLSHVYSDIVGIIDKYKAESEGKNDN